jgi:small subunit ribosomal protein S20
VANSASAAKRNRQNEKNRQLNKARRTALKTQTRRFLDAATAADKDSAAATFSAVQKKLDQLAAKGTLHRNTAARRKSRLARRLNAVVRPTSQAGGS